MIYDLYVPKLRNYYVVNTKTNILNTTKTFNLETKYLINYLFIYLFIYIY